ncbi:MAG: type II toxin-antitoxin system Phd/YefM family antitoxin [Acidobacteriota bacterium]
MAIYTTYTDARARLAELWDRLEADREILMIKRRGHETMAVLPASEVESLLETAHMLRSPKNAARLLDAIRAALQGEGQTLTLDQLRERIGLA